MHGQLLLVVAGVLIAALLVLLVSLCLLESHANQNGLLLKRLKQRIFNIASILNDQINHRIRLTPTRRQKSGPRLCCVCGSAEDRHQHESTLSPLISDLMFNSASACGTSDTSTAQLLELLSRLARSSGESGKFSQDVDGRSRSAAHEDKKSFQDGLPAAATSLPLVISSSAATLLSTLATAGTCISMLPSQSATVSSSCSSSTSPLYPSKSQDRNSDSKDQKHTVQKRLVLEILMSSSQAGKEHEGTPAGLRLKWEADGHVDAAGKEFTLEAQTDNPQGAGNCQRAISNDVTSPCSSATSGRNPVNEQPLLPAISKAIKCSNSCCNGPSGVANAPRLQQGLDCSIAISDYGGECKERLAYTHEERSPLSASSGIAQISLSTKNFSDCCSSSNGQLSTDFLETDAHSVPVPFRNGEDQAINWKTYIDSGRGKSETLGLSDGLSVEKPLNEKARWCSVDPNFQSSTIPSRDALGSLKLTSFKTGAKSFNSKCITEEVNADIASALTALTVESSSRMGLGSGLGEIRPKESKERISLELASGISCNPFHLEDAMQQGNVGEHSMVELDDQKEASRDTEEGQDDHVDGGRREKRKKKNRAKRQKGKASLQTETTEGDKAPAVGSSEEHLSPKPTSEDAFKPTTVTEVEAGCFYGTRRGGLHSASCPYPFTLSGSMLQRKIKEQYDELVRSNVARRLTLAQVGRFTTCLVEAKASLQQKSETIQRRFAITKSLLAKADKSCFDRLCGQVYALEMEQKRLEEDTLVYNRLQDQLKQSPAYQKMLEYGRKHFELQPSTGQLIKKANEEEEEISFEELLAKEKKDSFWRKHGYPRSSSVDVR